MDENKNREVEHIQKGEGTSKFNPNKKSFNPEIPDKLQNMIASKGGIMNPMDQRVKNYEKLDERNNSKYVTVPLPSLGVLYPKHSDGETILSHVRVYDLTLLDEEIFTDPVFNGSDGIIDLLLRSKVKFVDPKTGVPLDNCPITVDDLLWGDRLTILVFLRISLDRIYKYQVKNPFNGEIVSGEIDLATLKTKEVSVYPDENNEFTYKLPKSGSLIKFKLLTARDEKNIDLKIENEKKLTNQKLNRTLIKFTTLIKEVDGNREPFYIKKFCEGMPLLDVRYLNKYINAVTPTIDLRVKVPVEGGQDFFRVLPITSEFFYPTIELR